MMTGFIYFIETADGGFVKIGYSIKPYQRLSQLGTLQPGMRALRLIGWIPGTFETERELHARFLADRDNGEWFRDSPELRGFIAESCLTTGFPLVARIGKPRISTKPLGRPRGPEMPCGWLCGMMITAGSVREHMAYCPNRPTPKGKAA
jgi:hypothetical protein